MDITLLLIKTYIPNNLIVNKYGVIINYLKYEVSHKGMHIKLALFSENGIWGGTISSLMFPLWGMGFPLTLDDAKFTTLDACVDDLWDRMEGYARSEKELHFVKRERQKWDRLSESEKLQSLKLEKL